MALWSMVGDWASVVAAGAEPTLAWGVFTRALGFVHVVALLGWVINIIPLAGSRGLTPQQRLLRCAYRDIGVKALWKLPSVLWINVLLPPAVADLVLVSLPVAGVVLGVCTVLGALVPSSVSIAAVWVILVSIDNGAAALMFPWDSLLLEATFLAAWLPPLRPLLPHARDAAGFIDAVTSPAEWDWRTTTVPTPLHAFLFRYLLVRLLVGFGKMKFSESTKRDWSYIRGFLINQPILTPLAWAANRLLPSWFFSMSVGEYVGSVDCCV